MAKVNHTKFAILGLLTTECRTGYAIKQMIDQSLTHFWKISYGQIYPTLKALVEEGLATVSETTQQGKPDKKEYHITAKGDEVLKSWLHQEITDIPTEKNELLLKLFFSRHQLPDKAIQHIKEYQRKYEEQYETYVGIEEMINATLSHAPDANFWLITLDYGKRTTTSIIEWCKATIEQLEAK
ncbi:PadR family transcriptional regulator [Bacillus alkalicellulosilyticus]|uniref:PadR family transcriptional regulator n=1 Tax=Alkalihalobacterium alkalicellulosilyticum TaxID=1912214 RepID=UPI0009975E65|nr:PadR family transcriptional regulator [Bacillus alkalicellulosilyticus]